jgi:3-dehydroquinate dehydratase
MLLCKHYPSQSAVLFSEHKSLQCYDLRLTKQVHKGVIINASESTHKILEIRRAILILHLAVVTKSHVASTSSFGNGLQNLLSVGRREESCSMAAYGTITTKSLQHLIELTHVHVIFAIREKVDLFDLMHLEGSVEGIAKTGTAVRMPALHFTCRSLQIVVSSLLQTSSPNSGMTVEGHQGELVTMSQFR